MSSSRSRTSDSDLCDFLACENCFHSEKAVAVGLSPSSLGQTFGYTFRNRLDNASVISANDVVLAGTQMYYRSQSSMTSDSLGGAQFGRPYSGRKNMSTIRLFLHGVEISQENGVDMFYDLNQDDSINL
jgi:hypothetical protein